MKALLVVVLCVIASLVHGRVAVSHGGTASISDFLVNKAAVETAATEATIESDDLHAADSAEQHQAAAQAELTSAEQSAAAVAEIVGESSSSVLAEIDAAAAASAAAELGASASTETEQAISAEAESELEASAEWFQGQRDDQSGGKGSPRFFAPRGKGCWIEQSTCPRWSALPNGRPFADGYFHNNLGYGWNGGRETEKRCIARAKEYHSWCQGGKKSSSRAVWRPSGRSAAFPKGGCWIRQSKCRKYPSYKGLFYDRFDGSRSSINKARCFARAKEYHKWCGNQKTETTTAEYRPTGHVKDYPNKVGCFIYGTVCPKHPSAVGYFRDVWGEANVDAANNKKACLARAAEYHSWCGAPLDETFTAHHKPSGRTRTFPSDLLRPVRTSGAKKQGSAKCRKLNANTLEVVSLNNAEGACTIPFKALRVKPTKSLSAQIISFDIEFTRNPGGSVGRHGGIFFGPAPSGRSGSGNTVIDWIDRDNDRGYRVYGVAEGAKWQHLTPSDREPHQHWQIIVYADGKMDFRSGDVTWSAKTTAHELNKPALGFWVYNGVSMKVLNFNIRPYFGHYKYVNIAAGSVKGNVQVTALPNGVELRSGNQGGGEGSVVLPVSAFGLPHKRSFANKRISFDVQYVAHPAPGPWPAHAGRHGGVFFGPNPQSRWGGQNAVVDWLEIGAFRGYRVYWAQTNEKMGAPMSPKQPLPYEHWEIGIDHKFRMQFTAGDTTWTSRLRAAWNGGFIGFWCYYGVTMRITNVYVTDLAVDVCSAAPCQNGGACTADGDSYKCTCRPGFSGDDCSEKRDVCTRAARAACNGGKCVSGADGPTCDCTGTGFQGKHCDSYKLKGWFRADNRATVFVDDEAVSSTSDKVSVVELKTAAKPGSTVTIKGVNVAGQGMAIAWLTFRGENLVTDASWECSGDRGTTWKKATVSTNTAQWGATTNMPENAKYIWTEDPKARDGWCRIRLPENIFHTGDRVSLTVKNTVSALCSRAEGSDTTLYGIVCGNGGVHWSHYYTSYETVRSEMRGQMSQCSRTRSKDDTGSNALYFGDCDAVPTIFNQLVNSNKAATIKGLRAETNPCKANPCGRKSECEWALQGPFPYKCTCKQGYAGQGYSWDPCQEHDECAGSNPCHHNARCSKTGPGKFVCSCKKGFSGDGKSCKEINPCEAGVSPCSPNAQCRHTGPGKAACACKPGFKGDGKRCAEIDSCATKPCSKHAKCLRTGPGSHTCQCKKGFVGDGVSCDEIDVCHPSPCSPFAHCTKKSATRYECACKAGYKGTGKMCAPVNPCDEKNNGCDANAQCVYTGPGAHRCECKRGYKGDGKSCAAVNLCESEHSPCSKNAICKYNGPGDIQCTCKSGFIGNGRTCSVADGCATRPCSPYAKCTVAGPSKVTCECLAGYSGDGQSCKPIDNCASGKNPCHEKATCRSTGPGTSVCTCKEGYKGSGTYCYEVNACESSPCRNADCAITGPGAYSCTCRTGYTNKGSPNRDHCVEKNNCNGAVNPCQANAVCKPTGPATHECKCKFGYRMVGGLGGTCEEVDRCLESNPCSPHAACQKTGPGMFLCTCRTGFEGDGLKCSEVNNCNAIPYPCTQNALCTKTGPAQHTCKCRPGYDGDGISKCAPHDNCVSNPCAKHTTCAVTGPAKHSCTPDKGYAWGKTQNEVVEIDNCKKKGMCSPFATCTKTGPGQHKCECVAGYHGDGVVCQPVDMCKTGPCDPKATCKNTTPGKFTCTCLPGHTGSGVKGQCAEINLCSTKNPCDAHADCSKTGPGRAACTCQKGWEGDGRKCTEINNCKKKPFPCSVFADCVKTGPGTHKCECKPGYKGDGLLCRFDRSEQDKTEERHSRDFAKVGELLPKVDRVIFDGHDRIQDSGIDDIHTGLAKAEKSVDKLATITQVVGSDLNGIAAAMHAVESATTPVQDLHKGPIEKSRGGLYVTDGDSALNLHGDLAHARAVIEHAADQEAARDAAERARPDTPLLKATAPAKK